MRIALRGSVIARLSVLAFLVSIFASGTVLPTSAATNDVRINEVESSGGVPGDWVELYNSGPDPVDISGFVFKDNDDTHAYPIPAGTIIPTGGYFLLEEAAFGFGLGGADSARLFAADGTTLIDSFTWTAHAATTYGRCPNGTGALVTTFASTKGSHNDCGLRVNEVESSGGVPGDWVELYNAGASALDISGFGFRDNDVTHTVYVIPAGTIIPAGGYFLLEEAAFGFGLGSADSALLFATDAATIVDSYTWTAHAATTYGRCPNGTGAFTTTTSVTKGAANDCGIAVKINEIESSGGSPGDWVELYNPSPNPADISGFVFKDSDDAHSYVIPAATSIAGNAYFLLEEAAFGFGLGNPDSARLYAPGGAALIDSFAWADHATTTYGRCPDGTGDFTTTSAPTKGAANVCPGDVIADPWPGDAAVQTADGNGALDGNMSGLAYQASGSTAPGVLWAVKNGPGTLFRLLWNGTIWTPDTADTWGAGKALHYPDGTGDADSEGVTFADSSSAGGIYVATERNNAASGVSRNAILRFDASAAGTSLSATHEWNLTANLPAVGPNLGLEAITWVPDSFLVAQGFLDESTGQAYDPSDYANHGDGLFFVGVEANGTIYAYALNHADGSFTRIATIASGFVGVMGLEFDRDRNEFWAVCDDGCGGRSAMLAIDPATGKFAVTHVFERPGGMPNLNNEGFAIAAEAECTGNRKPAFWADDGGTGGNAIRRGTLPCTDPDADDDGIADEVDVTFPPGTPQAANPNNETFSDQLLANGNTSGTIVDRNGRVVSIRELTNPAGVRIQVGDGDNPATFHLTGKLATIEMQAGTYELTDPGGTTTVHVVEGEAEISVSLKGTLITISVASGGSVTYTETTDGKGVLTGLTIDEQTDGVGIEAGGLGSDACGDIQIENVIIGSNGNETITGTPANDLILAKNGNDTVNGNGGNDCIDAGEGNDKVTTQDGSDVVYAGGGNNTVNAGGGNNAVSSANGNDEITTGDGDDVISAGGGNNKVRAGDGANQVTTENGNDEVTTGSGNDAIDAGGGNNKVNVGDGTNQVTTENGNDEIMTGAGDDTINGGGGNNKVNTGSGMDSVTSANGNDNIDCGDGGDTAHVGGGNNSNAGGRCETFVP